MGDTPDGPLSAAQSAQPDLTDDTEAQAQSRGFFSRIFEALTPADAPADDDAPRQPSAMIPSPGIGNLRRRCRVNHAGSTAGST